LRPTTPRRSIPDICGPRPGRRRFLATAAGGLAALVTAPAHAESQAGVCTLGIFPYVPALKVGELFSPMALEFEAALGVDIQLRTSETFEKFRQELVVGSFDIVLVHPFLYLEAHAAEDYSALARVDQDLRAVILTRVGGPIRALAELRGQTLALPPRGSGVSYLLRLAMLDEGLSEGVDLKLRHHQTKVSCLHAVAAGDAIGCVVPSFLGSQVPAIAEMQLMPAWQSAAIKSLVIAVHPRMPTQAREALRARILGWRGTDAGRTLLAHLAWPGMAPAEDADYAALRQLAAKLRATESG
jgi:phosphonate transport system substrate-binding protein